MQVEKLCLRWNDFQQNLSNAFGGFRGDTDFNDVTLACEDGTQLEAHKVILSTSSPLFKNLLRSEKHPHPMIFMMGVRSEDLVAAVDFLYCGVAKVDQENLDSFISIAGELQLKGLMESPGERWRRNQEVHPTPPRYKFQGKITTKENEVHPTSLQIQTKIAIEEKISTKLDIPKDNELVIKAENMKPTKIVAVIKGDLSQLDAQIQSLMEKSESLIMNGQNKIFKAHVCKVCGKEGMKNDIKKHIESNHVEGICVPCTLCEKTFRSRDSLRIHKRRNHYKSL